MAKKKKPRKWKYTETVEEFLKRGGKITKVPAIVPDDPSIKPGSQKKRRVTRVLIR